MVAGVALWIAGVHWAVVLVVLGLVVLFIAGIWGVRQTRGTNPDDGSQYAGYSQNLLEVTFPNDPPPPP
jgi:ABC-type transporter Mla subunit MlaD